ncbi:MAG: carboxypeptidase M32 [Anaerolineales bacterium]|jgi:carboxypeptidase Taq
MPTDLDKLKARLQEIYDLEAIASLLSWDQSTYMPPGGSSARGRQLALAATLAHERLVDAELGHLLDRLEPLTADLPYDSDDASLIRLARRDFDRATRVPADHLSEFHQHLSESYEVWRQARPENDFARVRPYLEKTLEMSRAYAEFFPGYEHIADPLIDVHEYGMKASRVRAWFSELRQALVPMVERIVQQPEPDMSPVHQRFPPARQLELGLDLVRQIGFDPQRARQDRSAHPFMTRISLGDIRMTTRVKQDDLTESLFSTLHETGHALYELGIDPAYEGTPLAAASSSGVHESQSRLWENLVGRSLPYWEHTYPKLQAAFPDQLSKVPLEAFYRSINRVQRSLIRTDADEVTYNLHVMIRFDLELDLLEGRLEVRDLPEAWRSRYKQDLGIEPPDDRDGVLQDVHWYSGRIGGGFQSYTLGNIMSAQFMQAAKTAYPSIDDDLRRGDFSHLSQWLAEHVHRPGRKFTPEELVERATGRALELEPYLSYLRDKFEALYPS